MRSIFRITLAVVVGLLFALPIVGDDVLGGGDSGIWILPRSSNMVEQSSSGNVMMHTPRATRRITSPSASLSMQMPPEMGAPFATLWEVPLGTTLPIYVSGNHVVLSLRTMQTLLGPYSSGCANGLFVDAAGQGFSLSIRRTAPHTLQLDIY